MKDEYHATIKKRSAQGNLEMILNEKQTTRTSNGTATRNVTLLTNLRPAFDQT